MLHLKPLFHFTRQKRRTPGLVAHDCGYPLSRYTYRAARVAADSLDFIAFCRCSTGVALHPLKILVSHLPPPVPGGVAPKFGSEKVSRYTGVSQLQLRVSRYTVQLRHQGNLDVTSDVVLSCCCCPSAGAESTSQQQHYQFGAPSLWSGCPPRRPENRKQLKWRRSDSAPSLRGEP